jgi:hypothetical protein
MEEGAREIVGDISDKEFLARRAAEGMMPRLNRVFEELGIHHGEHKVPAKVLKLIEDKVKKAATKNATAVAESKKRRGAGGPKVVSKKQKVIPTSTAASAAASAIASVDVGEEVAKNVAGGSASGLRVEGEHSTASLDLGGDDFIQDAL